MYLQFLVDQRESEVFLRRVGVSSGQYEYAITLQRFVSLKSPDIHTRLALLYISTMRKSDDSDFTKTKIISRLRLASSRAKRYHNLMFSHLRQCVPADGQAGDQ